MEQMKKYIKLFLCSSIILFSIAFASCQKEKQAENQNQIEFLSQTSFGLYSKSVVFRYDNKSCQYSINSNKRECRLQSDNGEYIACIELSSVPKKLNEVIETDVTYIKNFKTSKYALNLEILKIENNTIWFWDSNARMGVIIPKLGE